MRRLVALLYMLLLTPTGVAAQVSDQSPINVPAGAYDNVALNVSGISGSDGPHDQNASSATNLQALLTSGRPHPQEVIDGVKAMVAARDFASLNALERDYRTNQSRDRSGLWYLAHFYAGLERGIYERFGECAPLNEEFYADWIAAEPTAPTPYISKANSQMVLAWCARGSGFANSVTADGFARFGQLMHAARQSLQTRQATTSSDPHYYQLMVAIAASSTIDGNAFHTLVADASARQPYYYGIYFAAVSYYLPQWNGRPGDIDRFARWAATRTSARDGTGTYARVMWYLDQCGCLTPERIDMAMMRRSMADVVRQYPRDWNTANFARLSCQLGDNATAAHYFSMIRNDRGAEWSDHDQWRYCRLAAGLD